MPWIKVLVSIGMAVLVLLYGGKIDAQTAQSIYNLVATLAATLLGFVFTALSILVAVPDKRLVSSIKKSGHYSQLTRELFLTSVGMFLSLVTAVVMMFGPDECIVYVLALLIGVFTISLALFASSGHKFYLVLDYIAKDH